MTINANPVYIPNYNPSNDDSPNEGPQNSSNNQTNGYVRVSLGHLVVVSDCELMVALQNVFVGVTITRKVQIKNKKNSC